MFTATQAQEAIARINAMTTLEDLNDMGAELNVSREARDRWTRFYNRANTPSRKGEWMEKIKMDLSSHVVRNSYNED